MAVVDLLHLPSTFRARLLADLLLIVIAALVVWVAGTVMVLAGVDQRTAHLAATLATVAVTGAVAVVGALAARTSRDPRSAWLGAGFGLYAIGGVSLAALGPRTLEESPSLLSALIVGNILVVVLLVLASFTPIRMPGWVPWAGSVACGTIVVAVGAAARAAPAVAEVLSKTGIHLAVALGWVAAALLTLAAGLNRRHPTAVRVGLGLALIAFAELYRVGAGIGFADPNLLFSGLQLAGSVGVLGGALDRLHSEVSGILTEQERQRAELREAVQHIERAAALGAERDHELGNGLAGLAGIAYLLDEPAITSNGAELRSAVLTELARLHAMLGHPGRREAEGPFDAAEALAELVVLRQGSGMQIDLDASGDLVAASGRNAFAQAVTNLLTNCERHAPGSPVRLHAYRADERVVVEVHDEGPGVIRGADQALLERGVTAGATGGAGLGLHVSARLIEEQGGSLRVLPRAPLQRGFGVRLELPSRLEPRANRVRA